MRRVHLAALVLAGGAGALTGGEAAFGQVIPLQGSGVTNPAALSLADPTAAGKTLSATIAERFEVNDNYNLDDPSPGTSYFADTLLSLGYMNQTDTQSLQLGLDTGLRALWQAQEPFEFTVASPSTASLDYANEWANGLFDIALDYRQREVDQNNLDDISGQPGALDQLNNDSRELRYDANIGVVFGTATPSSYELRFIGNHFDYSEDNPNEVARTTLEGQAAWNLQLNPILASRVSLDYLTYSADNLQQTELDRSQVGAGLVYTPSEVLTLGAGVNYAQRERTDLDTTDPANPGPRETTQDNDGPGVGATFNYVLPDLVLSGEGEWTTAAPQDRVFGTLRASYILPRGRIGGRVFQNYIGTSDGADEARVTGVGLNVQHDINLVSSVAFDFSYATQVDVDDLPNEVIDPDISRVGVTATYTHALTQNVSADIGYAYRSRDEDPENAASNAIFFQIGRTFETRP